MKINLAQVAGEPFDWRESLTIDPSETPDPQAPAFEQIECRGKLTPSYPGYLLQLWLSYTQKLRCVRCLEDYDDPVKTDSSLMVEVRDQEREPDEELELQEKDLDLLSLSAPELDTKPLVMEQLQLGVPMKPLCRPECAGLCAECGKDLNQGPCDCRPTVDSRWGPLARLTLQ